MKALFAQLWFPGLAVIVGLMAGFLARPTHFPDSVAARAGASAEAVELERQDPTDPVQQALGMVRNCRTLRELARLGPVLEKFDAEQMGELLESLERDGYGENEGEDFVSPIVGWWTRRDHAAATAWLAPELRRYLRRAEDEDYILPTLAEWAEAAPEAALEFLRPFADRSRSYLLMETAVEALSDHEPEATFRIAKGLPPAAMRDAILRTSATAWLREQSSGEFRASLAGALDGLDEGARQVVLAAVIDRADRLDLGVEYQLASTEDWATVLTAAAERDGAGTAAWLDATGDDDFLQTHALAVARAWAAHDVARDAAKALDWARAQGVLSLTPALNPDPRSASETLMGFLTRDMNSFHHVRPSTEPLRTVWEQALDSQPDEAIAWLAGQAAGAKRDTLVEIAGRAASWRYINLSLGLTGATESVAVEREKRLAALTPLALALPEEAAMQFGYQLVNARGWTDRDATTAWVKALPEGSLKMGADFALGEAEAVAKSRELPDLSGFSKDFTFGKTEKADAQARPEPQLGTKIEGRTGWVYSPHDGQKSPIDVRGLPSGTTVEDPFNPGRTFVVP